MTGLDVLGENLWLVGIAGTSVNYLISPPRFCKEVEIVSRFLVSRFSGIPEQSESKLQLYLFFSFLFISIHILYLSQDIMLFKTLSKNIIKV